MSTLIKKVQDAFQHEGTTLLNTAKLLPAALKEMAILKRNGNQLGFIKEDGLFEVVHFVFMQVPNYIVFEEVN